MIQQPVHWSLFEQFVTGSFWGSFVGLSGLHMLCYFWWFVRGVLSMTPIGPQIKTQITVDMDIEHSPHKCCCRHHHSQYQLGVYGSVLSGQIQMMVSNSTQQIIKRKIYFQKDAFAPTCFEIYYSSNIYTWNLQQIPLNFSFDTIPYFAAPYMRP